MPEFPFILEDVLASEVAPSLVSLVKVGKCIRKKKERQKKRNKDQMTNGPINAHPISGPIISKKHTKPAVKIA